MHTDCQYPLPADLEASTVSIERAGFLVCALHLGPITQKLLLGVLRLAS